jgi:hypothetical protein
VSEDFQDHDHDHDPAPTADEATGNPTVDAVLESVAGVEGAPVAEHVAVFESAHERLRSALADAGDDRSAR